MLTKSLHTITAATNVARFLLSIAGTGAVGHISAPETLAAQSLTVLGYDTEGYDDPTVQRIVANCAKLLKEAA